jgi:hypothetical protein
MQTIPSINAAAMIIEVLIAAASGCLPAAIAATNLPIPKAPPNC